MSRILRWRNRQPDKFARRFRAVMSLAAGVALVIAGGAQPVSGQLLTVDFDDFEGLKLQEFDVANDGKGDGCEIKKS